MRLSLFSSFLLTLIVTGGCATTRTDVPPFRTVEAGLSYETVTYAPLGGGGTAPTRDSIRVIVYAPVPCMPPSYHPVLGARAGWTEAAEYPLGPYGEVMLPRPDGPTPLYVALSPRDPRDVVRLDIGDPYDVDVVVTLAHGATDGCDVTSLAIGT